MLQRQGGYHWLMLESSQQLSAIACILEHFPTLLMPKLMPIAETGSCLGRGDYNVEGDGRNQTMSSPTTSLNTLICKGILTRILQVIQADFVTTNHLPALTRRLDPAYSAIEEIVEGFVEGFLSVLAEF